VEAGTAAGGRYELGFAGFACLYRCRRGYRGDRGEGGQGKLVGKGGARVNETCFVWNWRWIWA